MKPVLWPTEAALHLEANCGVLRSCDSLSAQVSLVLVRKSEHLPLLCAWWLWRHDHVVPQLLSVTTQGVYSTGCPRGCKGRLGDGGGGAPQQRCLVGPGSGTCALLRCLRVHHSLPLPHWFCAALTDGLLFTSPLKHPLYGLARAQCVKPRYTLNISVLKAITEY